MVGGAFDPVHNGHIQLAEHILDAGKIFDEVWLMPCFQHIYNKKMTDSKHRVNMLTLAVKNHPRIKVCNYEITKELRGATYQLFKHFLEEDFAKNQYDFSFAMGLDNAMTFHKWVNYKLIRDMITFVVVSREGYSLDTTKNHWFYKRPHIFLPAEKPIVDISSTRIRKLIKRGNEEFKQYIDPAVARYIENHKLYKG